MRKCEVYRGLTWKSPPQASNSLQLPENQFATPPPEKLTLQERPLKKSHPVSFISLLYSSLEEISPHSLACSPIKMNLPKKISPKGNKIHSTA